MSYVVCYTIFNKQKRGVNVVKWLKHFFWFIKESKSFMDVEYIRLILFMGCIQKACQHANYMVKWDKMTPEQREYWYLTSDRTIELND